MGLPMMPSPMNPIFIVRVCREIWVSAGVTRGGGR